MLFVHSLGRRRRVGQALIVCPAFQLRAPQAVRTMVPLVACTNFLLPIAPGASFSPPPSVCLPWA